MHYGIKEIGVNRIILPFRQTPNSDEKNIIKIIELLGCDHSSLELDKFSEYCTHLSSPAQCLIISYENYKHFISKDPMNLSLLNSSFRKMFIWGYEECPVLPDIACNLSAETVKVNSSTGAYHFIIGDCPECFELRNHTINAIIDSRLTCMETDEKEKISVIIDTNQGIFFFKIVNQQFNCEIFFCGTHEIADIDQTVSASSSLRDFFPALYPLTMFLRHTSPLGIWLVPKHHACLIVDDPYLRRKYGFFQFDRVLKSVAKYSYSVCIAFIPWNFWRTNRQVIKKLKNNDRFSICIHGCDHSKKEYASESDGDLNRLNNLALKRMASHRKRWSYPFDMIMVFPQGHFSKRSIFHLKNQSFACAINSTLFWSNYSHNELILRDLLDLCLTKLNSFPIFKRFYTDDIDEMSLELFFGKPAFTVEHHGAFSNDMIKIEANIKKIQDTHPFLDWKNIKTSCFRTHKIRKNPSGHTEVFFYTPVFYFSFDSNDDEFIFIKSENGRFDIKNVTINSIEANFYISNGQLKIRYNPIKIEELEIRINYITTSHTNDNHSIKIEKRLKNAFRRVACDIRDNYICKLPIIGRRFTI